MMETFYTDGSRVVRVLGDVIEKCYYLGNYVVECSVKEMNKLLRGL